MKVGANSFSALTHDAHAEAGWFAGGCIEADPISMTVCVPFIWENSNQIDKLP